MWPKRVSVWTAQGEFVRDYIGPATYGGMGAAADPADKTRVFGNGCEFKLDYEKTRRRSLPRAPTTTSSATS